MQFLLFDYSMVQMDVVVFSDVWGMEDSRSGDKKAALDQVCEGLMVLEEEFGKCSKCMDFFGGDWIGYVDIALGSLLRWVNVMEKMNRCKATWWR